MRSHLLFGLVLVLAACGKKADTSSTGSAAPGSAAKATPTDPSAGSAGSSMTGSAMTGSAMTGSAMTGSATAGSAATGSAATGSAATGSAATGSAATGSAASADSPALTQAITDATTIFSTLAPILKEDADACEDSLKDIDKHLKGDLADAAKRFDAAMKDKAIAAEVQKRALDPNAGESPLKTAWSQATVGAMHCGRSSDKLFAILHLKVK